MHTAALSLGWRRGVHGLSDQAPWAREQLDDPAAAALHYLCQKGLDRSRQLLLQAVNLSFFTSPRAPSSNLQIRVPVPLLPSLERAIAATAHGRAHT